MWSFRKEIHKLSVIQLIPDPPCTAGMDVAFLIDYTGSMGAVIDTVKASVADIVTAIETEVGAGNYRLGLLISDEYYKVAGTQPNYVASAGYLALPAGQKNVNTTGPLTNQYNTAMELFAANNDVTFTNQLNLLNTGPFPLGSGAGTPEPLDMAIDLTVNSNFLGAFRINVAKYILVFTDATPGGNDDTYNVLDDIKIAELQADCISAGIKVIVIGNGASQAVWQNLATNTGGTYNVSYDSEVIISQIQAGCLGSIPPIANAGADQLLTAPASSTTLDGSLSSDSDGTITGYLWEQTFGGASTITTPNAVSTTVTGMSTGTYTFRLTVTDNDGLQDTDFIDVVINAGIPPVADAGLDISVDFPTTTVSLDGSGSTDADGTIVTYLWEYVSGPGAYTITNPNSVTTTVTGMLPGTYVFKLTVTDNDGSQDTDTVTAIVGEEVLVLYDGVLQVESCSDGSGENTLVDFTGVTPGDTVTYQGTGVPFPGGGNSYFLTGGGINGFYDPITIPVSNFLLVIDNSGEILSNTPCI